MELTLAQAAAGAELSVRRFQEAVSSGDLPIHRVVGTTQTVDSAILNAFLRAQAHGRRWAPNTRQAALDLLSGETVTTLTGSALSRLKSRLRTLPVSALAYHLGASRGWYRYRSTDLPRVEVEQEVIPTGPSLLGDTAYATRLGLVAGPSNNLYATVTDLDSTEATLRLIIDSEGDIFLTERTTPTMVASLIDLYLFGDVRESLAAEEELIRRLRAC
ncbi:MAG: hypothetical protein FWD55_03190 [Propionibacteriaceae bacterium]|nr:hypothetical protein [Propionibacteriaceae bacterium]